MLSKAYSKTRKSCRVTFTVPREVAGDEVHLCGEFNDWRQSDIPLVRRKDGRFSRSLSLRAGQSYRFRYLIDGRRWENDSTADDHVTNPFGSEDSVIRV